jgi:hypothetical protein
MKRAFSATFFLIMSINKTPTNSMELSPSSEATSFTATQEYK